MFYPRPLQQTVPQYVGLDVHLACMRFRPARYPKLPAKLAFVPYPLARKFHEKSLFEKWIMYPGAPILGNHQVGID